MSMSFESCVAFYCAPTLAGIKPSNLFTWRHVKKDDSRGHIDNLKRKFAGSELSVETLCECSHYSLVFIYRREMLENTIKAPEVTAFLSDFGYPGSGGLAPSLDRLKARTENGGGFPHEIGIFLGYPLHDVKGFIKAPDRRCRLSGEWKVYANESETEKIFDRIRKCRDEIYRRFTNGSDIASLMA